MSEGMNETNKSRPPGDSLADCLMSQYRMTAAGIGLGTAYSLRYKKGAVHMVAAGALGTTADMVYGYLVACRQHRVEEDDDVSSGGDAMNGRSRSS